MSNLSLLFSCTNAKSRRDQLSQNRETIWLFNDSMGGEVTTEAEAHLKIADYFPKHAQTNLAGLRNPDFLEQPHGMDTPHPQAVFSFGFITRSIQPVLDCQKRIRIAIVNRFSFSNLGNIMFDLPFDL